MNALQLGLMVSFMKLETEPNMRERVFKAFTDLIILRALAEQPMTGYKIIRLFHKKFGILPNSSMIYSNLRAMEKKKWIKPAPTEDGKTYCVAPRGQKILDNMNLFTQEIRDTIKTTMETQTT
jgi:DNA-binding PadR family transcriptional regulator